MFQTPWTIALLVLNLHPANSFTIPARQTSVSSFSTTTVSSISRQNQSKLFAEPPTELKEKPAVEQNLTPVEQERLSQSFGGYTVKQRLREEVESPFRKVRLIFFASSAGSALTALYFSATNALKAYLGGYSDAPPLDESLTSCAINIGGAIVCGYFAYRDYKLGIVNLERISKGAKLAKLGVLPGAEKNPRTLSEYRRSSRVLICAGGEAYVENVCKALNSDQLADENNLPQLLEDVDVLIVPVLLTGASNKVGDTKATWRGTIPSDSDRNFDSTKSDAVVAFPWNNAGWAEYLESEIETAVKQGFDVQSKGITIMVKKNGKILRRATGAPRFGDLVETMEVMDGSKFGMPGDSERYGGP